MTSQDLHATETSQQPEVNVTGSESDRKARLAKQSLNFFSLE